MTRNYCDRCGAELPQDRHGKAIQEAVGKGRKLNPWTVRYHAMKFGHSVDLCPKCIAEIVGSAA